MNRLFFAAFVSLFPLVVSAFPLDITGANLRVSNSDEFVFENIRIGHQNTPQWGRFRWNSQTNSFMLVDFAPMTPVVVGRWDLSFDIGCDGSRGRTSWNLNADGSCVSGDNRTCRWMVNSNAEFRLEYLTGGRTMYVGKYTGGAMVGTFASPDGRTRGCWTAVKMQNIEWAPNLPDPRARQDSSGAPIR